MGRKAIIAFGLPALMTLAGGCMLLYDWNRPGQSGLAFSSRSVKVLSDQAVKGWVHTAVTLRNNTAQGMNLMVEPHCGCLTVTLADRRLEPGEQTELLIQTDIRFVTPGIHTKTVSVIVAGTDFQASEDISIEIHRKKSRTR
jgi:hypothetical protein